MIKTDTPAAKDLFEVEVHYEVPPFQRPYVWDKEDQWIPLWEDIVRVAESHLEDVDRKPILSHFLGAVVFELTEATSTGVKKLYVIDGQQRLTTLQLLLDAAQQVFDELEHSDESERLNMLILNGREKLKHTHERFKIWPSRVDQAAFESAMGPTTGTDNSDSLIARAHAYFVAQARQWLKGETDDPDQPVPGDERTRAEELCNTLISRLSMVSIDLGKEDDPQMIFETLNDRGTPLLEADLVKNWVFRKGMDLKADVDSWAENIWLEFDDEWWRAEISQGRFSRSRIDIFLQYWLILRTLDEVKSEHVFRVFTEYSESEMTTPGNAEKFLKGLRLDADTYRKLTTLDPTPAAGRFNAQVVEAMESAATMPVFLWFISPNHEIPMDQIEIGLASLESWVTRRTLLRLTSKDLNRLMVACLKELAGAAKTKAGTVLRNFLSIQTAESRRWPSDHDLRSDFPGAKVYGMIKGSRVAAVLSSVEKYRRSQTRKHEDVPIPVGLSIEHVMPRGWRTYWDEKPPLDADSATRRDALVDSIGNLTTITQSLNSSLSNRPWTDQDAKSLKDGGEAGKGKRSLLQKYSLLTLNKQIVDEHPEAWTEADIAERGKALAEDIVAIWPGPDMKVQTAAVEKAREGGEPKE